MFVLLPKTNINFQGQRYFWMTFSGILILIGLIATVIRGGPKLSIDFTGGVALTVRAVSTAGEGLLGEESVRGTLAKLGIEGAEVKTSRSSKGEDLLINFEEKERLKTPEALIRAGLDSLYPGKWRVVADEQLALDGLEKLHEVSYVGVSTELPIEDLNRALSIVSIDNPQIVPHKTETGEDIWLLAGQGRDAVSKLMKSLRADHPKYSFEVRSIDMVGPRIGSELRTKAVLALIASWILIILFLWWRFDLVFGIAAVIALIHDVVITFGIMVIFDFEISMTVIGAFLTIIGFSVNDTIVTFDRIRENLKRFRDMELKQLINLSINQTLSRTIITNGSVFIVVGVLLVFGGEVLRSFSFAMFIGSIIGTYSSIYIAAPILIDYAERSKKPLAQSMKNK